MTLLEFKKLKCIRGNLSVLFKQRDAEKRSGELLFVNHQKKTVMKMLADPQQSQVEQQAENLIKRIKKQKDFNIDRFDLHPEKKKYYAPKTLDGYQVQKWIADCQISTFTNQNKTPLSEEFQRIVTYEDYIQHQEVSYSHNIFLRLQAFPQKFQKQIKAAAFNFYLNYEKQQDFCLNKVVNNSRILSSEVDSASQGSELVISRDIPPHGKKKKTQSLSNAERSCSSSTASHPKQIYSQFSASHIQSSPVPAYLLQTAEVSSSEKRLSSHKYKLKIGERMHAQKYQKPSMLNLKSKKTVHAQFWLARNGRFPLNFQQFLPIMQIVSFASKKIAKIKDFLASNSLPDNSFPIKAIVPLFMSVNAQIVITNYKPLFTSENLINIDCKYINSPRTASISKSYQEQIKHSSVPISQWKPENEMPFELLDRYDEEDSESQELAARKFESMLKRSGERDDEFSESIITMENLFSTKNVRSHIRQQGSRVFSPKSRITNFSIGSEAVQLEQNSMDLSQNLTHKNQNELHVMLPTQFKLIRSLQMIESRNQKQAKKNMALIRRNILPLSHLKKRESEIGFFNYDFRQSFSKKHLHDDRISIASQNINDSILSDTIPKINSTRSRKVIKVQTLSNLEREFNFKNVPKREEMRTEHSAEKIPSQQKDFRDEIRLSSLFRDMRRGQEMHGIMWGRHQKYEPRKTVYLNTIESDEHGHTLNTESDYIGRGATPIDQIYKNLDTQNSVSGQSEEEMKQQPPEIIDSPRREKQIQKICTKFEDMSIENILKQNSAKLLKKSPKNSTFSQQLIEPFNTRRPVKQILQRFEDYIIDENLQKKGVSRSIHQKPSEKELHKKSLFGNLASSLSRGKASTFKVPKSRDADVNLNF